MCSRIQKKTRVTTCGEEIRMRRSGFGHAEHAALVKKPGFDFRHTGKAIGVILRCGNIKFMFRNGLDRDKSESGKTARKLLQESRRGTR